VRLAEMLLWRKVSLGAPSGTGLRYRKWSEFKEDNTARIQRKPWHVVRLQHLSTGRDLRHLQIQRFSNYIPETP